MAQFFIMDKIFWKHLTEESVAMFIKPMNEKRHNLISKGFPHLFFFRTWIHLQVNKGIYSSFLSMQILIAFTLCKTTQKYSLS